MANATAQKTESTGEQEVFRYERKYFTQEYLSHQLRQIVLRHPAIFSSVYYPRQVFSIYFDTPEFEYYQQNFYGEPERKKVRMRWYEHNGEVSPLQIEIKIKNGEMTRKFTQMLSGTIHDTSLGEISRFVQNWLVSSLQESVVLQPVLVNSYLREYFESRSANMRITIDYDLRFLSGDEWLKGQTAQRVPATILECKYEREQDSRLADVVQGLPLLVTRSSKYVMGVQKCYPQ